MYWQRVDALIDDQQRFMERIRTFSKETCAAASLKNTQVSDFLNENSPQKDNAKLDADEFSISSYVINPDDDNDDNSSRKPKPKVS